MKGERQMQFHSTLFRLFKFGKEERLQENELQNTFPVCVPELLLPCSGEVFFYFIFFIWESGRLDLAVIKTAGFIELEWSLYEITGEQGPVWDVYCKCLRLWGMLSQIIPQVTVGYPPKAPRTIGSGLFCCSIQERKSNDGAWVSELVLPVW